MMFRFFHFIAFVFLVQEVFAQNLQPDEKISNYISSCWNLNSSREIEPVVIEKHDTIFYYSSRKKSEEQIDKIKLDFSIVQQNPVFYEDNNGNLYACWINGLDLMFKRSTNGGTSWSKSKLLIKTNEGMESIVGEHSYIVNNEPSIVCDTSNGEFKNRIYISWTDAKYSKYSEPENSQYEDKDVFLIYSDDQGETWTEPILVTYRPNHKAQFGASMALDQKTGFLYLAYYDEQNYANEKLTDIILAVSKNGGLKFDYFKVNKLRVGYYSPLKIHMHNYATWVDFMYNDNYQRVELNDSAYAKYKRNSIAEEIFLQIPKKMVSFSKKIRVPIQLQDTTKITAVITKPLDPYFEKLVFKEKNFKKGKNKIKLNTKQLGLEKGNYTLFLYYNGHNKFVWIVTD